MTITTPDPRDPRVRTVLWIIGSVAAAVLAVGAIFLTTSIYTLAEATRSTQVDNTLRTEQDRARDERTAATAADAARAAARIEECTTPGRDCFIESQRRLGRTVGTITDYALAAAYCADQSGEQSIADLERCILDEIRKIQQPQPQENR